MPDTPVNRLPERNPFGVGPTFPVVLRADSLSLHGNVRATAGTYEAQQAEQCPEGVVTIWSPDYYAAADRGGGWVTLAADEWTFPGEAPRPIRQHDCGDPGNWKSGVAGGVFCTVCRTEVEVSDA